MSLIIDQSFPCNLLVSFFINNLFQTLNMIMQYSYTVSNKNVVQKKEKENGKQRYAKHNTENSRSRSTNPNNTWGWTQIHWKNIPRSTCGNRCFINANCIGETYSKFVCYTEICFFFWPLCCSSICLFCLPLWYLQTLLRWDIIMCVYISCYFAKS